MNRNNLLKQVTYQIYKKRSVMDKNMRTNYRIERVNGGFLCDLWFLTAGCRHDAAGGCVMCNYGKSIGRVEETAILKELQSIVNKLSLCFEDFLLTSSGSLLDEREVSVDMRERLISILRNIRTKRFIIETRCDTISDSGIDFLKRILPDSEKYIEIGVESSDDWILKYCINKEASFEEFRNAVKKLHDNGIYAVANIGLGFPFMSERASMCYTIQSVKDALSAGADSVVIFPYHVKRGTLLDVMYQQGMYENISLWSLIEVLNNFSEEELQKIQISWYKDYFGEEKSNIYQSPGTCPKCQERVMKGLDQYRDMQEYSSIKMLSGISCTCRDVWRGDIAKQADTVQADDVEELYRKLARIYKIEEDVLETEVCQMRHEYMNR